MSPDSIFIRFLEVPFYSKVPKKFLAVLRDWTKKSQFLSKHVIIEGSWYTFRPKFRGPSLRHQLGEK
jgi:hypothetical protein